MLFIKTVFRSVATVLAAACVAAGLLWYCAAVGLVTFPWARHSTAVLASATPAMDFVEQYQCPRAMKKLVQIRGVEDGFSRGNTEPAEPRAALLRNIYFQQLISRERQTHQKRDYDERGVDKILLDSFTVPRGIDSGVLLLRLRGENGSEADSISLGDFDEASRAELANAAIHFSAPTKSQYKHSFLSIPLADFKPSFTNPVKGGLIDYLNSSSRVDALDMMVQDDSVVDVAALIVCQLPEQARGLTFHEFRVKAIAPDISMLTCGDDKTQGMCDPFAGDQLCSVPTALACYKAGGQTPPPGMQKNAYFARFFVNGEVRLTDAVRGDRFATLAEANQYCAARFGAGWRVLSYQEGGGGNVISRSSIAPRSRAWVDIRNQRYGNCWDRGMAR
jgi:hypothetical protein